MWHQSAECVSLSTLGCNCSEGCGLSPHLMSSTWHGCVLFFLPLFEKCTWTVSQQRLNRIRMRRWHIAAHGRRFVGKRKKKQQSSFQDSLHEFWENVVSASQNNNFPSVFVLLVALSWGEMQRDIASADIFISGGPCCLWSCNEIFILNGCIVEDIAEALGSALFTLYLVLDGGAVKQTKCLSHASHSRNKWNSDSYVRQHFFFSFSFDQSCFGSTLPYLITEPRGG